MELLRPYGVVMNGKLELGVELLLQDGSIQEIRPHTGVPDSYVVSTAFVNAHSHFEYRGMQDQIAEPRYFEWIWELTQRKGTETAEFVAQMCDLAASENHKTGIAKVGEHSDRLGSAKAMQKYDLGGWIFQEMLDAFDSDPAERCRLVEEKADFNRHDFKDVSISPHAYHTVLKSTLMRLAAENVPLSIHVCETGLEEEFLRNGKGQIAESRHKFGLPVEAMGKGVVELLDEAGLLRPLTQCVHVCAIKASDIEIFSKRGVTIAHCPRSNIRLQCPAAPVRELLDAGLVVGLGLDSPASGGSIDMFAEMRAALEVAYGRGKPLKPEEVWRMATTMGARSFGLPTATAWDIYPGSTTPLIKIHHFGALSVEQLIEDSTPDRIEWVKG
jgi:cytosine/adenosine deaminase-related metal-dependent hydrolase